jgi:hypothetical protein
MRHSLIQMIVLSACVILGSCAEKPARDKTSDALPDTITLARQTLKDKIKGGWAGQTIGVTFGGPTEFRFNGTFIQDYHQIKWYDGYLRETMENNPGLYDDIYMDLTFVEVFEKHGLDAPVDAFAQAYANAEYMLWHANQAGRYNILHGIPPPHSGHWMNNPHADCIDYQIESDFAGLMSPGMPNAASQISDKVGHIMNYGDGWYGGVFVGAMYALAFTTDDVNTVVREALKTIPSESRFYRVIRDVIGWHEQYPDDWKQTWFEIQKKYAEDIGCPDGVFAAFNIDATVNAAYVVLGLLYGEGDFTKTLEISTRAGQDSDCNPSTAGGILGTILGYENIPLHWKGGLAEAESLKFKYTSTSLLDVYEMGFDHALENVRRHGGVINDQEISIPVQRPLPVRLEQSFEGHYPKDKINVHKNLNQNFTFSFVGNGFVMRGNVSPDRPESDYVARAELYLDGQLVETIELPANFTTRRYELCWKYKLPERQHSAELKLLNPDAKNPVRIQDIIIYSGKSGSHTGI